MSEAQNWDRLPYWKADSTVNTLPDFTLTVSCMTTPVFATSQSPHRLPRQAA